MTLLTLLVLCVLGVFLVGGALADLHKDKVLADHDARRITEIKAWLHEIDPNGGPD